MMKEMLIKGGAIVTGILVSQVIIEKLEKASLKRDKAKQDLDSEEGNKSTKRSKKVNMIDMENYRKAE